MLCSFARFAFALYKSRADRIKCDASVDNLNAETGVKGLCMPNVGVDVDGDVDIIGPSKERYGCGLLKVDGCDVVGRLASQLVRFHPFPFVDRDLTQKEEGS